MRQLAQHHGVSLNKLVDEWASMALAQFDAETRFLVRAAPGSARRGLALLNHINQRLAQRARSRRGGGKQRA